MIEINSPIFVILPRKTKEDKKYPLNLNQYRNLHHHINAQAKVIYTELMADQLKGLDLTASRPCFRFELYKKWRKEVDSSNIYCIVEKFFCDALVHYGCIKDDSDKYIGERTYVPGLYGQEMDAVKITISRGDE